ncbi:nicotinate phosphoribosyltransferase [Candidatus Chlorohelix sp.]|uniref:nicotinate phosphoribosyltransferase n=1 Tax=Candidatus Chlorohelix sp. TaxID=3139201 RepID=UPI00305B39B0
MNRAQQRTAEGILFTDQYQLTMAQLYFRQGLHEKKAQFDHYFRNYPDYGGHSAGFCINAGLEWLLDWMKESYFRDEDIACLRSQTNHNGTRLFADDFLEWLRANGNFEGLTLQAIPEGRVVHPDLPLTVVTGPIAMAQIIESALLNQLNYQVLIATKAARLRQAAGGRTVLEFGMRRGQGTGANAGARAALIGGADFTSNVGISHVLGYTPRGTHAHSMVQLFNALGEGELESFRAFAEVYPDDCILLVDTVNTLESGIPNAIKVFEELRRKGHKPAGIRLDSGDLAYLSIQGARMLDAAGFPDTSIVLSNELDELVIWQIQSQIMMEAPRYGVEPDKLLARLVYGVGTHLITSHGHPALGGVFKLVAVEQKGEWLPALKLSETTAKIPNPGNKQAWRLYDKRGKATADVLSLEGEDLRQHENLRLYHPSDPAKYRILHSSEIEKVEPLLVEMVREGKFVYDSPSLEEMRAVRDADLSRLDEGVRRIIKPHVYHVSLSENLWQLKQRLIAETLQERYHE